MFYSICVSAILRNLAFGRRFGPCSHPLREIFSDEEGELTHSSPCPKCNHTLESYLETLASASTWPASNWLCTCGAILSHLTPACPCNHSSRKSAFAQQTIFILRQVFLDRQDVVASNAPKPCSLNTLLLTLYHPDHLEYINAWSKAVAGEPAVVITERHLKVLSPEATWICNQQNSQCDCKGEKLGKTRNETQAPDNSYQDPVKPSPSPAHSLQEEDQDCDMDSLEIHASKNLLELSGTPLEYSSSSCESESDTDSDGADTYTAPKSPPYLRSRTMTRKEESAPRTLSLPSRLAYKVNMDPATRPSILVQSSTLKPSISNIKDRLGPKIVSNPSTSKVAIPDAFPCFFKENYPPSLNPHTIRQTNSLPSELTGPSSSAIFIKEMYCLEMTQFYKSHCPPSHKEPPILIPEIFANMRRDQLTKRKDWLLYTHTAKLSLRYPLQIHADRSLTPQELGHNRIPLEVILSMSAHQISPNLKFFEQLSMLKKLENLTNNTGTKRKAQGSHDQTPSKKPTPLMEVFIPAHIRKQIPPSAGSFNSHPTNPVPNPRPNRNPIPPLRPREVDTNTTRPPRPQVKKVDTITTRKQRHTVDNPPTQSCSRAAEYHSNLLDPPPPPPKEIIQALTPEQTQKVENICQDENPYKFVTHKIRICDILRLQDPKKEINDRLINHYFGLIEKRMIRRNTVVLNTNFYPMLLQGGYQSVTGGPSGWIGRYTLFSPKVHTVLIPIHQAEKHHWTLAAINTRKRTILYYDSSNLQSSHILKTLQQYIVSAHWDIKNSSLDLSKWTTKIAADVPQQQNNHDCGVFTMKFAENHSRGAPQTFSQDDIPLIRQRMIFEIITNQILPA